MILYVLAFLIGFLSKYVDAVEEHGFKFLKSFSSFFGTLYGLLIAYTIIRFPVIAPLWLATVVGVFLSGKIDTSGHKLAMVTFILSLVLFWTPEIDFISIALFIVFLTAGILDEVVSDKADEGFVKNIRLNKFLKMRPLLEATAIAVSVILKNPVFFFTIFSYDIGYIIMKKLSGKTRS